MGAETRGEPTANTGHLDWRGMTKTANCNVPCTLQMDHREMTITTHFSIAGPDLVWGGERLEGDGTG